MRRPRPREVDGDKAKESLRALFGDEVPPTYFRAIKYSHVDTLSFALRVYETAAVEDSLHGGDLFFATEPPSTPRAPDRSPFAVGLVSPRAKNLLAAAGAPASSNLGAASGALSARSGLKTGLAGLVAPHGAAPASASANGSAKKPDVSKAVAVLGGGPSGRTSPQALLAKMPGFGKNKWHVAKKKVSVVGIISHWRSRRAPRRACNLEQALYSGGRVRALEGEGPGSPRDAPSAAPAAPAPANPRPSAERRIYSSEGSRGPPVITSRLDTVSKVAPHDTLGPLPDGGGLTHAYEAVAPMHAPRPETTPSPGHRNPAWAERRGSRTRHAPLPTAAAPIGSRATEDPLHIAD